MSDRWELNIVALHYWVKNNHTNWPTLYRTYRFSPTWAVNACLFSFVGYLLVQPTSNAKRSLDRRDNNSLFEQRIIVPAIEWSFRIACGLNQQVSDKTEQTCIYSSGWWKSVSSIERWLLCFKQFSHVLRAFVYKGIEDTNQTPPIHQARIILKRTVLVVHPRSWNGPGYTNPLFLSVKQTTASKAMLRAACSRHGRSLAAIAQNGPCCFTSPSNELSCSTRPPHTSSPNSSPCPTHWLLSGRQGAFLAVLSEIKRRWLLVHMDGSHPTVRVAKTVPICSHSLGVKDTN